MVDVYPKAYKEVYEILKYIEIKDYNKIPEDVIQTIEKNMDKEYDFILDTTKEFEELNLLEETKALIAVLFRDYWTTPEQKARIIAKEKRDLYLEEEKKKENYKYEDLFKKDANNNIEVKEDTQLIEYKESKWNRFVNKIKLFLGITKK